MARRSTCSSARSRVGYQPTSSPDRSKASPCPWNPGSLGRFRASSVTSWLTRRGWPASAFTARRSAGCSTASRRPAAGITVIGSGRSWSSTGAFADCSAPDHERAAASRAPPGRHPERRRYRGPVRGGGLRARSLALGPSSFKSPGLVVAIVRLAVYLRRHAVRLVHCFDFYSNILGVPAARLARTPAVIASQRDMGDLRSRGQQCIHSVALGLATHILVNSEAIAVRLAHTRVARQKRLGVVPNGVDLTR